MKREEHTHISAQCTQPVVSELEKRIVEHWTNQRDREKRGREKEKGGRGREKGRERDSERPSQQAKEGPMGWYPSDWRWHKEVGLFVSFSSFSGAVTTRPL